MPWLLRPHATVRGRLLSLLLLASLPVLLLAALGSHAFWRGAMDRAMWEVTLERDRTLAANRAAIEGTEALLRGLAVALAAAPSSCATLLSAVSTPGLRISVRGAAGAESCTRPEAVAQGIAASHTMSPVTEGAALTLSRPLPAGSDFIEVIARLELRGGREGAFYWLVDETGLPQGFGLRPLPPDLPSAEPGEDAFEATAGDGMALLVASGMLRPGMRLAVAVPAAPARKAALGLGALHMAEVVVLLTLSAAAVLLGTGYSVTRPLRRLRDAVARWDAGARSFDLPATGNLPDELRDLAESIRAGAATLARREEELRSAIAHAELLAGEVHHRVKNNLQTVSSLLALQANRVSDPSARAEFEAARDRVGALATLHRHLYVEHDPEAIDFRAFIDELATSLFAGVGERPGRRIALEVDAPALRIGTDQAVPLALVITEAVADALRKGFPEDRIGRIAIRLAAAGERARLDVEDDGALPRTEDPLRVMLLRGLGRQLGGTLRMEEGRIALDFPLRPPAARQPVSVKPSWGSAAGRG